MSGTALLQSRSKKIYDFHVRSIFRPLSCGWYAGSAPLGSFYGVFRLKGRPLSFPLSASVVRNGIVAYFFSLHATWRSNVSLKVQVAPPQTKYDLLCKIY